MSESHPTEEQRIMAIPLSDRTQEHWDALHDIFECHNVYCECPVCKDVYKYLRHIEAGGRIGDGF